MDTGHTHCFFVDIELNFLRVISAPISPFARAFPRTRTSQEGLEHSRCLLKRQAQTLTMGPPSLFTAGDIPKHLHSFL